MSSPAMSGSALMPGGVFAVCSEDPDKAFERRLVHAGFAFKRLDRAEVIGMLYTLQRNPVLLYEEISNL